MKVVSLVFCAGCALNTDAGIVQRGPAQGLGASFTGHMGVGALPDKILAVDVDARTDLADGGSRLAFGASVLGGLPVFGGRILGRVGVWHAPLSSARERDLVPTFELAGYIPMVEHPDQGPRGAGPSSSGWVFGIREDHDFSDYVTVFVGLAVFLVPGP